MAAITIRNLDNNLKKMLRIRAARHERSMEEEVRIILKHALEISENNTTGLGSLIHRRFIEEGGLELPLPERTRIPRKPEYFA